LNEYSGWFAVDLSSSTDIYSVYYNCKVKPALRASAVEFLDNLLTADLQSTVVPLLEDSFDPETTAGRPERFSSFFDQTLFSKY